jgi:dTDP-glucose 4,6-dehydratase
MRALTGWSAGTSFEDGLERTVAWYRENEAWWRALRRPEPAVRA